MEYFKNNVPQRQIAKTSKVSSSTVHNIIKRFWETGRISVRKGQGWRPSLDACDLRTLRRHCITHQHDSVFDITKRAQEYLKKPLSAHTAHCAIHRCHLKLYHAKRKPLLIWFRRTAVFSFKMDCSKVSCGQICPNLIFLLEIMGVASCRF